MKLIKNRLCRKRYKVQLRIKKWFWRTEKLKSVAKGDKQ